MARVKRGVTARARHKKILKQAKGYYNARRKVFRVAKQAVTKALQYAVHWSQAEEAQFPFAVDHRVSTRRPASTA
jgi:large subunit ribosomal protein L20